MTLEQIINYVYPVTKEHRRCRIKMQQLTHRREKLRSMIEAYRRGDIVSWDALKISVDIEQILKQKAN